ncbi:hypothetical protein [Streptomyces sp. NPDC054786]
MITTDPFSACWGSRETLSVDLAEPALVAGVGAETAVDAGRRRHPVRVLRVRADMVPQDAPLFAGARSLSRGCWAALAIQAVVSAAA